MSRRTDGDTPSERSSFMFGMFLVIVSLLMKLVGVVIAVAAILAMVNNAHGLALVCALVSVAVIFLSHLISSYDEKRDAMIEEKRKNDRAKYYSEIIANGKELGWLRFEYDSRENVLKLGRDQLPYFSDSDALEVVTYGNDGTADTTVAMLRQLYNDKIIVIESMRSKCLDYCRSNGIRLKGGELVNEWYISNHLKFSQLIINNTEEDPEGVLYADPDNGFIDYTVKAVFRNGSNEYVYSVGMR